MINRYKFNIITLLAYILPIIWERKITVLRSIEIKEVKINKYKGSLILKIALIWFAIYLIFMLVVQRSEIGKKEAEKLMLQNDILQQEQVNHEIEYSIEKNALGVDEYAEEYARSELDYVKQGEKVFVDIGGN